MVNLPGVPLKARGNALTPPLPSGGNSYGAINPAPAASQPPMQGNSLAVGWSTMPNGMPSAVPAAGTMPNKAIPQQPGSNMPLGNTLGSCWDWIEQLRQQYQGQLPQSPTSRDGVNRNGYLASRSPYQG